MSLSESVSVFGKMRTGLSPQRAQVLAFIDHALSKGKAFPSPEAITQHMGWKNNTTVRDIMNALVLLGKIRVVGRERSLRGPGFRCEYERVKQCP